MTSKKRTILLLQGPMGPFFYRVGRLLKNAGWKVVKINFNLGDTCFYPTGSIPFRGRSEEWPAFLTRVLSEHDVERIFLFGDCRPLHAEAINIARALQIGVTVFEEGYLRPNFITAECGGVNGHSSMPRDPTVYRRHAAETKRAPVPMQLRTYPFAIYQMTVYAMCYFLAGRLGSFLYPHYVHHKPFHILSEASGWLRSIWRKQLGRPAERRLEARLRGTLSRRYFLVPLQVFNDAQVHHHSELRIEAFIDLVAASFARSAPQETFLLFKQHPMDRGHVNHEPLITELARRFGIADRVLYSRDCHLPTALDNALGTVVINSTVGLQSIHHSVPVKVLGNAIYDLPGLTFTGQLDRFWSAPGTVDRELYRAFRKYLLVTNQFYGSFSAPPIAEYIVRWARGKGPVPPRHIRQKERNRRKAFGSFFRWARSRLLPF